MRTTTDGSGCGGTEWIQWLPKRHREHRRPPSGSEDGLVRGVELRGLEPLTPTLPVWCATSCATAPCRPGLVRPSRGQPYRGAGQGRGGGNQWGGGGRGGRGGGDGGASSPPPAAGAQPCFIWAMRRWLPKGSRRP